MTNDKEQKHFSYQRVSGRLASGEWGSKYNSVEDAARAATNDRISAGCDLAVLKALIEGAKALLSSVKGNGRWVSYGERSGRVFDVEFENGFHMAGLSRGQIIYRVNTDGMLQELFIAHVNEAGVAFAVWDEHYLNSVENDDGFYRTREEAVEACRKICDEAVQSYNERKAKAEALIQSQTQ